MLSRTTSQFELHGYSVADRADHAAGKPVFNLAVGLGIVGEVICLQPSNQLPKIRHMSNQKFYLLSGSLALENKPFHSQIANIIKAKYADCDGYVGYKMTTLGRASDDDVPSFLIVTKQHGIVLVDVVEDHLSNISNTESGEYWKYDQEDLQLSRSLVVEIYEEEIQSRLRNSFSLYDRKTKKIRTPIRSSIVLCRNDRTNIETHQSASQEYESSLLALSELEQWLDALEKNYNCSDEELGKICALLEGTFIYEQKPSATVEDSKLETINDYIQQSLKTTFKQDESQRFASMQLPNGPQRIRGLAGTGKTVVLSLKAAITHKRLPDFKILYLFNTQSLYQNVQSLISKYYTLEAKKPPDFENTLQVFHAWGGRQKPGLYSTLCSIYGLTPMTLADARGHRDALEFIYRDLLAKVGPQIKPIYDLVLIDEAQDFPKEVFEVVFKLTKGVGAQKRIVWAYDEFQSLKDTEIKGPSELFGKAQNGAPNLDDSVLEGKYAGDIPKDFVLPNCYRTPRPVLMTAHGVALGLYSSRQNEMFYYPSEWQAIGYKVNEPKTVSINSGDKVEIERPDENSKNLLESLMRSNNKTPLNLIQVERCADNAAQLHFLSTKVHQLINKENVAPEEIIIVNLSAGANKESMLEIQRTLNQIGVKSVIPGYVESADVFKPKGFITLTTPFRAKGNEANVVFVINASNVSGDFTLRTRNAFFVAVTRSRGWCYISGFGTGIEKLNAEIELIKKDFPIFKFTCPDPSVIKSGKTYLNKSDKELNKIQELMELLDKDPDLRELLLARAKEN